MATFPYRPPSIHHFGGEKDFSGADLARLCLLKASSFFGRWRYKPHAFLFMFTVLGGKTGNL